MKIVDYNILLYVFFLFSFWQWMLSSLPTIFFTLIAQFGCYLGIVLQSAPYVLGKVILPVIQYWIRILNSSWTQMKNQSLLVYQNFFIFFKPVNSWLFCYKAYGAPCTEGSKFWSRPQWNILSDVNPEFIFLYAHSAIWMLSIMNVLLKSLQVHSY